MQALIELIKEVNSLNGDSRQGHTQQIKPPRGQNEEVEKKVGEVDIEERGVTKRKVIRKGYYMGLRLDGEVMIFILAYRIKEVYGYSIDYYICNNFNISFNDEQLFYERNQIKIRYDEESWVNTCVLINCFKGIGYQEYRNYEKIINLIVESIEIFKDDKTYRKTKYLKTIQKFVQNAPLHKALIKISKENYDSYINQCGQGTMNKQTLEYHLYGFIFYGKNRKGEYRDDGMKTGTSKNACPDRSEQHYNDQKHIFYKEPFGYLNYSPQIVNIKKNLSQIKQYQKDREEEGNKYLINEFSTVNHFSKDSEKEFQLTGDKYIKIRGKAYKSLQRIQNDSDLRKKIIKMEKFFEKYEDVKEIDGGYRTRITDKKVKNFKMQDEIPTVRVNWVYNDLFKEKNKETKRSKKDCGSNVDEKEKYNDGCNLNLIHIPIKLQLERIQKREQFEINKQYKEIEYYPHTQKVKRGQKSNLEFVQGVSPSYIMEMVKLFDTSNGNKMLQEMDYRAAYKLLIYEIVQQKLQIQEQIKFDDKYQELNKQKEEQNIEIRREADELAEMLNKSIQENKQLKGKHQELRDQQDQLKEENKQLKGKNKELIDQQNQLKEEIQAVQKIDEDKNQFEEENNKQRQRIKNLQEEKGELQLENEEMKDRIKELEKNYVYQQMKKYTSNDIKGYEKGGITTKIMNLIRRKETLADTYDKCMQIELSQEEKSVLKKWYQR